MASMWSPLWQKPSSTTPAKWCGLHRPFSNRAARLMCATFPSISRPASWSSVPGPTMVIRWVMAPLSLSSVLCLCHFPATWVSDKWAWPTIYGPPFICEMRRWKDSEMRERLTRLRRGKNIEKASSASRRLKCEKLYKSVIETCLTAAHTHTPTPT